MTRKRLDTPMDIIAPDPTIHREGIFDLLSKTFSHGGYWNFQQRCRGYYIDDSHYSYPHSRIGIVDGKIVTHWGVWDYAMRVGSGSLRVAGVGAVATHGEYLKRGLMSRTIRHWLADLDGGGFDATVLFGIPDFYHKFGYVLGWPGDHYNVATCRLPDGKGPCLRKVPLQIPAGLTTLANRYNAGLTGTAVRPTYHRRRDCFPTHAWGGQANKPAGFVTTGRYRGSWQVMDHAGPPEDVLQAVRILATRDGVDEVLFTNLHARTPLAMMLRQATATRKQNYALSGGPMIRTLNLASGLKKLCGEMTKRLKGTPQADFTGRLTIRDPRETVRLNVHQGTVSLAEGTSATGPTGIIHGGEEIAQLLIGTHRPEETVQARKTKVTGAARKLLPVLFPAQDPCLATIDAF